MKLSKSQMEKELSEENYDPNTFLQNNWKSGSADDTRKLRELRSSVQFLAEDFSESVKKNVFYNYNQFIETSKEVSRLENNMVHLSLIIGEQKCVIESMMNTSFSQIRGDFLSLSQQIPERRNLTQQLLEMVDDCCHLNENVERELIYESDLTQLNPETMAVMQQIHALLFTDGLMLTVFSPKRFCVVRIKGVSGQLGQTRYKFTAFFEVENVAFINVKDNDNCRNVFKLLVFPQQSYYKCESALIKRCWFESLERAKKSMIRQGSLMRQATIRIKTEKKKLCDQATINNQSLDKDQSTNDIGKHDSGLDVEWIRELPDELDDFLAECCNTDLVKEMTEKFEQKENQLAEKLMIELKPAMDKYLQGGPKATRKTVLLLIKLDKISQACDLFLKNQSASIKYLVKELKLIDNPFHYVQQLNRLVCNTLAETVQEFRKLFADYPLCFSVLILWASGEMKNYTSLFIRHIFQSGLNLKATARCIKLAFEGAEVLMQSSLDLKFELEMLFEPHIEKMLDETERLFIDAMKLRIAEDRWRPYNLRSKARLSQYISEMNELHLEISDFVFGKEDCRLSLTSQMCSFARAVVPLTYELCELRQSAEFIANAIDQMMFHIWEIELNYLKNIPDCVPKEIYADNLKFCVGRLLPLCEKIYTKSSSIKNFDLLKCLLEELASDLLPFYEPFYIPESKYEVLGEV
ncbi:Exocyst complex component 8 [Trichinella pseudospiralis]|uniref:Exocyst complex component 8 n=1 Tax=Trichinella pseudospiralis TaxID=6337 RepID=A0A0V0Y8R8_TRIPS|nr:Exocyst complex component 8 [Trichinella pseudospiralis]